MALGRPSHVEFVPARPCAAASAVRVRDVLSTVAGVVVVRIPTGEGRVLVGYDPARTRPELLKTLLAGLGWKECRAARSATFAPTPRDPCC